MAKLHPYGSLLHSVFDVIMSGAKKNQPPLMKTKTHHFHSTPSKSIRTFFQPLNNPISPKNPNTESPNKLPRQTSTSWTSSQSSSSSSTNVAEVKKRISLLKKTPSEFDPSSVAWWKKGEPVPFLFLSLAFDMIKEEKGRKRCRILVVMFSGQ